MSDEEKLLQFVENLGKILDKVDWENPEVIEMRQRAHKQRMEWMYFMNRPAPVLGNEVLREKGWERVTYYINPRYGDEHFTRAEALRFEGREDLLTIAERAENKNDLE